MGYYIDKEHKEQTPPLPNLNRDFVFPAGELHIELSPRAFHSSPPVFRLRDANDIMRMLLIADALRRQRIPLWDAVIPYIPYARQDRVAVEGEPLSIRVMANLINSCGFARVYVFDPHSDVSLALINNVKVMDHSRYVLLSERAFGADALVCPDAGARKKIKAINSTKSVVYCDKKRDPKTGQLSGFEVHQNEVPESVLIVDDICDGGGTFIGLAQELKAKGAKRVGIYVSHGIFSKGLQCLKDGGIDCVITTDSFCTLEQDAFLTVFPIAQPY